MRVSRWSNLLIMPLQTSLVLASMPNTLSINRIVGWARSEFRIILCDLQAFVWLACYYYIILACIKFTTLKFASLQVKWVWYIELCVTRCICFRTTTLKRIISNWLKQAVHKCHDTESVSHRIELLCQGLGNASSVLWYLLSI